MELDDDLPAQGKYYCVPCSRYFISGAVLAEHEGTKAHKKRVRELRVRGGMGFRTSYLDEGLSLRIQESMT